jgi:cysteine-rich repeat protein
LRNIMRTSLLATLLGLSLVACAGQIDGGGGDPPENCGNNAIDTADGETCDDGNNIDGDGCSAICTSEAAPRVDVTVDKPTISTELGTTNMVTITVTGGDGFAGQVAVAASLVDALDVPITGWLMAVNPPTVTVPLNGSATAVATFSIPTENVALAGTLKVTTTSSATEGVTAVDSAVTVANQLTIPMVLNAGGQCTYPSDGTLSIKAGTKVRWVNNELAGSGNNITIHIEGNGSGFSHQSDPGSLPQGTYEQTATTAGGAFNWYCHAPGPTVNGLMLQVVP